MSKERDNEFINLALQEWGEEVLTVLAARIRERKLVLTGELLRSLQYEVLQASADSTAKLLLTFQEAGRIRDMRAINRRKQAPVEVIEEFVRKVGLSRFRYVPGYRGKRRRSMLPESAAVNRIAWGIVRKQLARQRHKPKKWFSKTFYAQLDPLIDRLLTGYAAQALESITENLNDNG